MILYERKYFFRMGFVIDKRKIYIIFLDTALRYDALALSKSLNWPQWFAKRREFQRKSQLLMYTPHTYTLQDKLHIVSSMMVELKFKQRP